MPWYVCLGTMSKDFIKDELSETSLNGTVYSFVVDHRQAFIVVLSFSGSLAIATMVFDRTKCIYLNNELGLVGPTLMNLNSNELHYYPFMVSLGRCDGSCNTLDDLLSRILVPN